MTYELMAAWMHLMPLAAEGAKGAAPGPKPGLTDMLTGMWPLFLIIFVLYFLMIRPQQKQQRQVREMRSALSKGDHIVTTGGIRGVITLVRDHEVVVKVDDDVKLTIVKSGVSRVLSGKEDKGEAEDSSESK